MPLLLTKMKNGLRKQKFITKYDNGLLEDTTIYRVRYNHGKKEGCLEDYAWFISAMIKMGSIHRWLLF